MSHELQSRRAPVSRERVNPSLPDAAAAVRVDSVASRSAHREQLERYISSIFRAAYGASVLEFLPLLVCLQESDAFQAALGLRSARQGTLFCEHYLARPVQDQIHETFSRQVNRSQVMELGNLVASRPGQAATLYTLVVAALGIAGVSHLVFCANRAVRVSIRRCGFVTREICAADPQRLPGGATQWGSYYDGDPKVILADIPQAVAHGCSHAAIASMWQREQVTIDSLADNIRSLRA